MAENTATAKPAALHRTFRATVQTPFSQITPRNKTSYRPGFIQLPSSLYKLEMKPLTCILIKASRGRLVWNQIVWECLGK